MCLSPRLRRVSRVVFALSSVDFPQNGVFGQGVQAAHAAKVADGPEGQRGDVGNPEPLRAQGRDDPVGARQGEAQRQPNDAVG